MEGKKTKRAHVKRLSDAVQAVGLRATNQHRRDSLPATSATAGQQQDAGLRLGLHNLNEQLCTAMFGVVLGEKAPDGVGRRV